MDAEPAPEPAVPISGRAFGDGPLVGRDRELTLLREHLRAGRAGRGQVILIGGDAGIGKTTLAETMCREAAEYGALTLTGRCYDLSETPPYGPWREAFSGLPPDDGRPSLPAAVLPADRSGAVLGSHEATSVRVYEYLVALAASRPLVILLDDLQWSDPASLDLLRTIARQIDDRSIVIIVTWRPAESVASLPFHVALPTLIRESRPLRLDLAPLGVVAIHALVTSRYALSEVDARELTRYLVQRSDGNVFFLGEILRALEEQGGLVSTDGGWRLADLLVARVPELIKQVIANRLAQFKEEDRDALAVAAAIGQEVPIGLWQTISGIQDEPLLELIEHAVAARILVAREDGLSVGFYHSLTRESLYEGILPPRRRGWHRAIGGVLATNPMSPAEAVAHHFEQADDPRAAEWLIRAGEQAEVAYAFLTAADRYQAALRFIETSETTSGERGRLLLRLAWLRFYEDPAQSAMRADDVLQRAEDASDSGLAAGALFSRGHFRVTSGDLRAGLHDIRAGVAAIDALPQGAERWPRLLGALDVAPLDPYGPHGVLTATLSYCGLFAEAREVGERSVFARWTSGAGDVGYDVSDMQAYLGLGIAYAGLGEPEQSRRAFAAARLTLTGSSQHFITSLVDLYEFTFPIVCFQTDDIVERRHLIAATHQAWSKGIGVYSDEQLAVFSGVLLHFLEGRWDELRALAGRDPIPPPIRFFQYAAFGDLAYASGEVETAWKLAREVLPAGPATEPGSGPIMTLLAYQRLAASLALDAGDVSMARTWLEAHDRFLEWSGTVVGRAEGKTSWARYYRSVGDRPRAIRDAAEACRLASDPRQPLALIAARRTLAELLTEDGRYDLAGQHMMSAMSIADACAIPYERALTQIARATLWDAQGKPAADATQVRVALDEARDILTALGAVPALRHAEQLFDRIATRSVDGDRFPAGLTSREVEVLRLVAGGKSNREIADELGVSVHTVHSHVSHIFDKTGCENRAAATAFALRHRIVP